jgi:hypothetical protein
VQLQYPDICSSCVTTAYQHPSMTNLPVSAYDREGGGALLYCDSCPRSFHLLCLNPPIDGQGGKEDIPEGGWYCQECSAEHDFLVSKHNVPSPHPHTKLYSPIVFILSITSLNPYLSRRSRPAECPLRLLSQVLNYSGPYWLA